MKNVRPAQGSSASGSTTPNRAGVLGIRGKLLTAFLVMAGTTVIASAVGLVSYSKLGDRFTHITKESVPTMFHALELAEYGAKFDKGIAAFVESATDDERQHRLMMLREISDGIVEHSGHIHSQRHPKHDEVSEEIVAPTEHSVSEQAAVHSEPSYATVEHTSPGPSEPGSIHSNALLPVVLARIDHLGKERIPTIIASLDELVRTRVTTKGALAGRLGALRADHVDLSQYLNIAISDAVMAGVPVSEVQQSDPRPGLLMALLETQASVNLILSALLEERYLPVDADAEPLRARFEAAIGAVRMAGDNLKTTEPGRLAYEKTLAFLNYGSGENNIVDLRVAELAAIDRLTASRKDHSSTIANYKSLVSDLIATSNTQVDENFARVEVMIANGKLLLLALAGLSMLIAALLGWLYVGRNLLGRLARITGQMRRLSQGDLGSQIRVSGSDELGEMAVIVEDFRLKGLENRQLQEQRQIAAAEREKAVAETQQQEEARLEAEQRHRHVVQQAAEREQHKAATLRAKVDALLEVVNAAAEGDLTGKVSVGGDDAIGRMSRGLAEFIQKLRTNIETPAENAVALTGSANELTKIRENISINAEQNSAKATAVSNTAQQVSKNVETVATAAEEMDTSIRTIANNVVHASEVATSAVDIARETNASVSQLGESSAEIGNISKVITSIAQQTNLLALNATIEAARAGEAGKGFAVVAGEVKDLAKATSRASEDISKKIETIQKDTETAVKAIAKIGTIIDQVNDIQVGVSGGMEEQTKVARDIAKAVSEAAIGSAEIAHNILKVSETAGGTLKAVNEARTSLRELAQMATQLQDFVARFKYQTHPEPIHLTQHPALSSAAAEG